MFGLIARRRCRQVTQHTVFLPVSAVRAQAAVALRRNTQEIAMSPRHRPSRIFATLLAAIGLVLIAGGGRLLTLGGSLYYLVAGVAWQVSGALLSRGRRLGTPAFRAYDSSTGEQLWQVRLPAGGNATPMTYTSPAGRQFVVLAAGGSSIFQTKRGDYVIAYALPD